MSEHPSFIVVFKDGVSQQDVDKYAEKLKLNGGAVTHRYGSVLNGFAANVPASFLNNLQEDDLIKYIEPNGKVTTQ